MLLVLLASCVVTRCFADANKQSIETNVAAWYRDSKFNVKGRVSEKRVDIGGETVEYLEAGENAERTVLFCHGAAFSMRTWQSVGVLDALAMQGERAIAVNLPGYGESSKKISNAEGRDGFLKSVAVALSLPRRVVVVAASMGGSYGLAFVISPGAFEVAGYVTAAGVLSALPKSGARVATPTLAIYGSDDARLAADAVTVPARFQRHQLVVFENAPHPCYLRDPAAAMQFTNLVSAFVGGAGESVPALTARASW